MIVWANHFSLNLGYAVSTVLHAFCPPQWSNHTIDQMEDLTEKGFSPLQYFFEGLRT